MHKWLGESLKNGKDWVKDQWIQAYWDSTQIGVIQYNWWKVENEADAFKKICH